MQYDPDKYQYVMQAVKQLRGQMNINAITSWDGEWSSSVTNWSSSIQNEKTDFAMWNATTSTNTADILKSVNSTLNSNDVASTASEQMASIENDMFNLQNRLKNLKKEANTVFKWDVPQYIVNAYIANRTAEIQDQLWVLENRYNAAYSRYQNEWEKTKWEAEFDLKKQELEIKKQNAIIDNWATKQGTALKWADLNWTTNGTTPLSTLSVQEAMNVLSDFSSSYATGSHWGQCGEFVKKYLAQIGVNLPNMSSITAKQSLIDDSITEPNQWDVVIMSSTNYPENWHMAIVEWIDDDGTIHLLESNWNGDEQVHRRTISPNDKKILGYYRPSWTGTPSWSNGGQFTRKDWVVFDMSDTPTYNSLTYDQQNVVQQLLNLNKNPNTITKRQYWDDFEKILSAVKEINPAWTEDDFKQMSAYRTQWNKWANWGWISRNATSVKAAKELYEMVDTLDNIPNMTLNQLINASEQEFGWTKIAWFKTKLEGMIVEAAGALKWWNAANSDQDIQRMNNILDTKMSKWQIKTAIKELVNLLYWKNESEAQTYWELVLTKPKPIWVDEVTDWMYDDLWITTIPQYYNYSPNGWWYAMWQTMNGSNNLSNDEMVNNIFTY
jgi:surface antigen